MLTTPKVCSTCGGEYDEQTLFCPRDGSTLRPAVVQDELIGSVIGDRFLITDKLGEGGMGRVYLAQHVRLPQRVAIKVLHPSVATDATLVERFRREALNASQIQNEHVAQVSDFGEAGDGSLYLVMEYVEGEPLSKLIEREGALSPGHVAEITTQVADALAAAHERPKPIIHRDLKPDNIMVGRRRDGSLRVKVVDFGIAEAMQGDGPKLTQRGFVIGTPEYMSPEQLSAITLDWRSDIYSLALVTFDMLTGHLPFSGNTPQEAALMRLSDRPRRLDEVRSDVRWPDALQTVMDRALARAPAERYDTAPAFAHALAEAIATWERDPAPSRRPEAEAIVVAPRTPWRRAVPLAAVAIIGVLALARVGADAVTRRTALTVDARRAIAAGAIAGAPKPRMPDVLPSPDTSAVTHAGTAASLGEVARAGERRAPDRAAAARTTDAAAPQAPDVAVADVRPALDRLNDLVVDATNDVDAGRPPAKARAVVDSVPRVLGRLRTRRDTVELGVYAAAAYILLGQHKEACEMLDSVGDEASRIPRFERQMLLWNEKLGCGPKSRDTA